MHLATHSGDDSSRSGVPNSGGQDYAAAVQAAVLDPQRLEALYRAAQRANDSSAFATAITAAAHTAPDNLLLAAWRYRLQPGAETSLDTGDPARSLPRFELGETWRIALPLSLALALLFWGLSDPRLTFLGGVPVLALLWAPLTALALMGWLTTRQHIGRTIAIAGGLVALTAFALVTALVWVPTALQQTYLILLLLHLPLLAWIAVGLVALGWHASSSDAFAFLLKSLEAFGTMGVAVLAGGLFVGLTYGMFSALTIDLPTVFLRLLIAGGAGLIPVLAVASVYHPARSPQEQEFQRGFGKLLSVLVRCLLPLACVVLVIYVLVIPFNFLQPFFNRDALIVYNAVLFAVLALLISVTPRVPTDGSPRLLSALRWGIVLAAALISLVGFYALAAVIYRTVGGQLTMNRLVVIGWNVINSALLCALLVSQFRPQAVGHPTLWFQRAQQVFRAGMIAYLVWTVALIVALPWLFIFL